MAALANTSVADGPVPSRSGGVDAVRCIAIVGVIVIHLQPKADAMRPVEEFFRSFAVSFFYAAASHFLVARLLDTARPRPRFRDRSGPLLLPYLAWTAIYVAARFCKDPSAYRWPDGPGGWIELVCFGGGALHLYFVPTVVAGAALTFLLSPVLGKLGRTPWLCLAIVAASAPFLDDLHQATARPLVDPLAWNLALRVSALAGEMAPYLFLALAIHGLSRHAARGAVAPWVGGLLVATGLSAALCQASGQLLLPPTVLALVSGGSLFLGSLLVSRCAAGPPWLGDLGKAVYSIYLMHHLLIEGLEHVFRRAGIGWFDLYRWPQILVMASAVAVGSLALALGFCAVTKSFWRPRSQPTLSR